MSTVLAHRGNLAGRTLRGENSRAAIGAALTRGFGIETDIRRASDGRFYIAHDPQPAADEALADDVFELLRAYPDRTVALNVKEIGYESALLDYLRDQRVLRRCSCSTWSSSSPYQGRWPNDSDRSIGTSASRHA